MQGNNNSYELTDTVLQLFPEFNLPKNFRFEADQFVAESDVDDDDDESNLAAVSTADDDDDDDDEEEEEDGHFKTNLTVFGNHCRNVWEEESLSKDEISAWNSCHKQISL